MLVPGKNSGANTIAAVVPNRKKSYHSSEVPRNELNTTRRTSFSEGAYAADVFSGWVIVVSWSIGGEAGVAQAIAAQRGVACVVTEERPDFEFQWHPLHSRTLGCLGMNLYATWDPTHYMNPAILRLVETFQTTQVRSLVRLPSCRPDRPRG